MYRLVLVFYLNSRYHLKYTIFYCVYHFRDGILIRYDEYSFKYLHSDKSCIYNNSFIQMIEIFYSIVEVLSELSIGFFFFFAYE